MNLLIQEMFALTQSSHLSGNESANLAFRIEAAQAMHRLPQQFFATLTHKVREQIALGHDVINLGQGNPDQPTPPHIIEALQVASANPTYHGYPPFNGFRFLKEAIAERYWQDYQVQLDPEHEVAVCFGAKTGLVEISQCLLNPGDVCLVPDPGYPDYWSGIALAGGKMVTMPLTKEHQYLPVYEQLSKEDMDRAKLMFINYPNNPTGVMAPASFYKKTIEFAAKHRIVVASDFAYGTIGFDGHRPISFLQFPGGKDVGVEFYTLSKSYNMAGWRVGFALGHREVIRLINTLQDHYYCSLFGGIQVAAAAALTQSQDGVYEMTARYERRRNVLFESLDQIGWHADRSQGSFFTWLPVPAGYTSMQFADRLLHEAHVVVAPGNGFGQYGEGYVRLALLTDEIHLREAVHRISKLNLFQ
jgi:aminotransferase